MAVAPSQPNMATPETCLILSTGREEFFVESAGLTSIEASADTARLYDNIVQEVVVAGSHLEVCQRCMLGEVDEFQTILRRMAASQQLPE